MASRRHLVAFNRMLRTRGLEDDPRVAPLVELGRDLARVLDAKGLSVRPLGSYMAVLRAIERVPPAEDASERSSAAARAVEATVSEPVEPELPLNALERFRLTHGVGDGAGRVTQLGAARTARGDA